MRPAQQDHEKTRLQSSIAKPVFASDPSELQDIATADYELAFRFAAG
jgi:hypothetical protein